jgi:RHS repeat-associated protein
VGGSPFSVTYVYDVEGHRVKQISQGTETRFAYDGQNVWADLDSGNTVLVRYLDGAGTDQILTRTVGTGVNATVTAYLTDRLGSVRDLEQFSNQTIVGHLDYDGFGNPPQTLPAAADRYGFTGREYDPNTKLQYNRDRWYDPATARWQSEDRKDFGAGDGNLYRYVRNEATNATDPSGNDFWGAMMGPSKPGPGMTTDLFGAIPPRPVTSNPVDNLNTRIDTSERQSAMGQTPIPIMAGSAPIYGSNGGSNAAGAMVQVGQATMQMTQIATAPFMFTPVAPLAVLGNSGMNFVQGNYASGTAELIAVIAPPIAPIALTIAGVINISQENYVTGTVEVVVGAIGMVGMVGNIRGGWRGGPSRPVCFPAGTPVHTPLGLKAIELIAPGDRVMAFDHQRLCWVEREVLEVFRLQHQGPMATIQVLGEMIRATGGHPFWVVRGEGLAQRPKPIRIAAYEAGGRLEGRWVLARDLQPGDIVLLRGIGMMPVESVRLDEVEERVYNFHVAELQNYAVGGCGVLVHNTNDVTLDVGAMSASGGRPSRPGSQATEAGAQFQSHSGRPGWTGPKPSGNQQAINAQGQAILDEVLTNPKTCWTTRPHSRPEWGGTVTEGMGPDGIGVRFDANRQFVGFIE